MPVYHNTAEVLDGLDIGSVRCCKVLDFPIVCSIEHKTVVPLDEGMIIDRLVENDPILEFCAGFCLMPYITT